MANLFLIALSLFFSVHLMAQSQPTQPPPPPDDPGTYDIYLVGLDDPKAPPTDPSDAGDLLIEVDARGETLTITDGRGVGLILVLAADWRAVGGVILLGDRQGKVVQSKFGSASIGVLCFEALDLIVEAKLIDLESVISTLDSSLSECQALQSIIVDIKPNKIRQFAETGFWL